MVFRCYRLWCLKSATKLTAVRVKCLLSLTLSSKCVIKPLWEYMSPTTSTPLCPQRLHPWGEWPGPSHDSDRHGPAFPRGSGFWLGPTQPLLDWLGSRHHLRGFVCRQQEACPDSHWTEWTEGHCCGSGARVRKHFNYYLSPWSVLSVTQNKRTEVKTTIQLMWNPRL